MCLATYSLCTYTNFQAVDTQVYKKQKGAQNESHSGASKLKSLSLMAACSFPQGAVCELLP